MAFRQHISWASNSPNPSINPLIKGSIKLIAQEPANDPRRENTEGVSLGASSGSLCDVKSLVDSEGMLSTILSS